MGKARDSAKVVRAVIVNRALRRELLAYLLFKSAELATWIAMLVFAFNRGGAAAAGLVAVIQLVPAIFVAPLGSILGDRMRRDRALCLGYTIQTAGLTVTAAVLHSNAPIWLIYLSAAVAASAFTLTRPVHNAILPELAETPKQLTASNSVSGVLSGVAILVGPLAAGVMLALGSAALVFGVMALSQLIAALLTFRLRLHEVAREESPPEGLASGALGGFKAMKEEPGAAALVVLAGAENIVGGLFDVLVVGFALEALHLGQGGPGVLAAGDGVGALIGSAATILLIGRRRLAPAIGLGVLVAGGFLALAGGAPNATATILLFAASAVGLTFYEVAAMTLLQRTVRDETLARFFGVQEAMSMAGLALGAAIAPFLVAAFGIRGAFVAAGAFLPLLGLIVWRQVRALDERAHVPQPELGLLTAIDLFAPLAPPVLERLAWNLGSAQAKPADRIIVQGDKGGLFYLITEGRASVSVDGRQIATLGPGQYFGEIALLRDVPRTATVTAEEPMRLLTLERDEFLAAITGSRPSAERADAEMDRRIAEQKADQKTPTEAHGQADGT
jgi:MFS family permease